jgi:crotonobetainyl-CoA:carnitine CoA-transferase CaiB-like acyl-CoA transferase
MERRIANREALTEIIENWLQSFPGRNEPLAILEHNRILCGPVLDVPQSMSHPQRQARGTLQTVSSSGFGEPQTFRTPIGFSNAEAAAVHPCSASTTGRCWAICWDTPATRSRH